MKTSRLSKTAVLSIVFMLASVSMNAPAADAQRSAAPGQVSAFDMHDSGSALSPASSYAFYDGTESSLSAVAGSPAYDMSEFEPFHFSGGNSMASFDGSEDGVSNTFAGESRAIVAASNAAADTNDGVVRASPVPTR